MKKVCNQCPYRKASLPGYLGEASFNPKLFLTQLELPDLHPCHLTVDWENNEDVFEKPICSGAAHFCKNTFKLPTGRKASALVRSTTRDNTIFEKRQDFIIHHSNKVK